MSSIARVLHTTTWSYFFSRLPDRFIFSPNVVKKVIVRDINDLMQEFWRLPGDGADGASFFAMLRLHEILQVISEVCFHIIFVFCDSRLLS